jgi:hypothetical protein
MKVGLITRDVKKVQVKMAKNANNRPKKQAENRHCLYLRVSKIVHTT